jgi:TPR repeat protein
MIDAQFNQITELLHKIDYGELKKILPEDRKTLMVALQYLQKPNSTKMDLDTATRILTQWKEMRPYQTSLPEKIKKAIQNRFAGRVSSQKLMQQIGETEKSLWVNRGHALAKKSDSQGAFDAFWEAYQLGSGVGASELAMFFEEGINPNGVPPELLKLAQQNKWLRPLPLSAEHKVAYYLYSVAAEKGDYIGQRKYGELFAGLKDTIPVRGLTEKEETALGLYRESAGEREAKKWFAKAAKQGDLEAQFRLGVLDNWERGAKGAQSRGIWLIQEAAEAGHPKANLYMGILHLEKGIPRYPIDKKIAQDAIAYLKKASEAGEANADFLIALTHLYGDVSEKERWREPMEKAATAGVPEAQLAMASYTNYPERETWVQLYKNNPQKIDPEKYAGLRYHTPLSKMIIKEYLGNMQYDLGLIDNVQYGKYFDRAQDPGLTDSARARRG